MKHFIDYIQRHLTLRLGMLILLIVTMVFAVSFSISFYHTRQYVRKNAINHATKTLDSTVLRITSILDKTERITSGMENKMRQHIHPDSLLAYTRLILEEHPEILGFTVSMKPGFFPQYERFYSAYSLREGDSITSVIENINYSEQMWYKNAMEQRKACWLDPYIDNVEEVHTSHEYNFSYAKPLFNENEEPIGVLCAELGLKWLSQTVTAVQPYPHSSAIVLSHDGSYIVHPDTTKLVKASIFSDPDPEAREDVRPLGEAMLAGYTGFQQLVVDGQDAYVFYQPLKRTGGSIAIVCPASDIFNEYNHLIYVVWSISAIGLLLLLFFCYQTIRRAVVPVNQLAQQAQRIADGHFDEPLPHSNRLDTIGQLQNSFILMQQSLAKNVSEIRQINTEMEQHNQELIQANQLVHEADKRKTAFVQDMAHQIRTPLNIINGFTQVFSDIFNNIPEDELMDITSRMKSSAKAITRITRMLIASSNSDSQHTTERTTFPCNALCQEAVSSVILRNPDTVSIAIETSVDDTFTIHTDRQALLSILDELLDNANKFTSEGTITLGCRKMDNNTIMFTVSDTGPGIDPSDHDRIFTQFTKLDSFTEGIGLGLFLSRHTVHLLGGDLTLDDTYHSGTRFRIILPTK